MYYLVVTNITFDAGERLHETRECNFYATKLSNDHKNLPILNCGQNRIEVLYLHLIVVLFISVSGVNADFVFRRIRRLGVFCVVCSNAYNTLSTAYGDSKNFSF